jgi:hypothetical protein
MKISRNKTLATAITTILVLSMSLTLFAIPSANAYNYDPATQAAVNAGMYWNGMDANATATRLLLWNRYQDKIPTHVYIIAAPSPIGVGQTCNIVMFNPQVPEQGSSSVLTGYPARYSYKFSVKTPSGAVQDFPQATQPSYSSWSQNSVVNGLFVSDSTGSTYMSYIPTDVGNYTLTVYFQQFQYLLNATNSDVGNNNFYGVTYLASNYTTTLSVQDEPVSLSGLALPNLSPLPTEFWTRPIEGQNVNWYQVASNWLNSASDNYNGGYQNMYQPDGTAPNSGHILWTRPTEDNGIVGGNDLSRPGNSFDAGAQYQPRFTTKVIMHGRLYYSPNLYTTGSSELLDCVDLRTGALLWEVNTTSFYNAAPGFAAGLGQSSTGNMPQFGYYYSEDTINEHGIDNPGWLFTNNYGIGYQPERGVPEIHVANVPGGATTTAPGIGEIKGPAGENIRYVLTNVGTTANPVYNLLQWNSSRVIPGVYTAPVTAYTIAGNVPITNPAYPQDTAPVGQTWSWNGAAWVLAPTASAINCWNGSAWVTTAVANIQGIATPGNSGGGNPYNRYPSYDWNKTITYNGQNVKFASAPVIEGASLTNKILWGYNITQAGSSAIFNTWPTATSGPSYYYPDTVTIWAISLDPNSLGTVMYMKNIQIDDPKASTNLLIEHVDASAGTDGVFVAIRVPDMTFFIYNMRTGELIGQTDAQADTVSPFGYFTWPSLISMTQTKTAYGMFYTGGYGGTVSAYYLSNASLAWRTAIIPPGSAGTIKESPAMMGLIADGKIYVGTHEHSAETPLELGSTIKVLNATTGEYIWQMSGWAYPLTFATADGILIYWNQYDGQVYAVGKGPTSATVSAPDVASAFGAPVVIKGTVIDVSAGTKQKEQAARFPNGVPAVSDASMSEWMDYVYQQKARPSNVTGVEVTLSVLDANNNFREIGKTTGDSNGFYSFQYTPDIAGKYTVYASFAGSESYWPSYAETAFAVMEAPPAPPEGPAAPVDMTGTYIMYGVVAIIIAIAIVGAVIILVLRKRP